MKKYRNILLLVSFVFLALIISGCAGESTNNTSDEGDDSNSGGRIIVPDADWDPVEPEDEEPVADADSDGESTGTIDDSDDSGVIRLVEPEINIEVYLDGELYESGTPVHLFHDQTVEALIKIRATGSELSFYQVTTTEQTQRPFEGRLSGYEDDLTYIFTYNYVTWGEGGLSIIVTNRLGDAHMQNVLIIPVEIPGFDPSR